MKAKKKLLLALCIVVVLTATVAGSVLGTIAYLTSSAAVSNVFTVGNVQIVMDEGRVNSEGKIVNPTDRVDTNTYHLVPGKQYDKDPQIRVNSGSEDSYLFVLVRNDLETIGPKGDTQYMTIAEQMYYLGWKKFAEAATGDVYIYCGERSGNGTTVLPVNTEDDQALKGWLDTHRGNLEDFNGNAALTQAGSTYNLFKYFYTDPTNTDLSTYGAAKITLTAVAIQATGFGNGDGSEASVEAAWEAVLKAYPYIHTNTNTTTSTPDSNS